jgi:hypothetical protein
MAGAAGEARSRKRDVKHATGEALGRLSELLAQIRLREGLKEKTLGVFYRRSKAFLHFHEDPAGLFADLRAAEAFTRFPVSTAPDQEKLLAAIDRALAT